MDAASLRSHGGPGVGPGISEDGAGSCHSRQARLLLGEQRPNTEFCSSRQSPVWRAGLSQGPVPAPVTADASRRRGREPTAITHRENNSAICCTALLGSGQAWPAHAGSHGLALPPPGSSEPAASLQWEGSPTAVLRASHSWMASGLHRKHRRAG